MSCSGWRGSDCGAPDHPGMAPRTNRTGLQTRGLSTWTAATPMQRRRRAGRWGGPAIAAAARGWSRHHAAAARQFRFKDIVDLESGKPSLCLCLSVCLCVCVSVCLCLCLCLGLGLPLCLSLSLSVPVSVSFSFSVSVSVPPQRWLCPTATPPRALLPPLTGHPLSVPLLKY
jgi:hypothetical protein